MTNKNPDQVLAAPVLPDDPDPFDIHDDLPDNEDAAAVTLKLAPASQEDGQAKFLREIKNTSLWQFLMDRNPKSLAEYARRGGDLNNPFMRNFIIGCLDAAPFKKGGGKAQEHLTFYHEVNRLMEGTGEPPEYSCWPFDTIDNDLLEKNLTKWFAEPGPMNKGAAINRAILNLKLNISESGGHDKYSAGKVLAQNAKLNV